MGKSVRHYCTLFDQKYLPQGLALYESLVRHTSTPFRLWILALDLDTWQALTKLRLPYAEIIPLESFEHAAGLREIRASRTWQEYCWGLASQFTQRLINDGLLECTYLDSDCWFLADPEPVFRHIAHRSIAITPHQFPDNSEKPRLRQSGEFNVGFVHFKNTPVGRKCLDRWAAQVRERCSADVGCGDQCYLDSWCSDYGDEVCVLGVGVNMGPWNLMAHDVSKANGDIYLGDDLLVCYHFHEYRHGERLTNYPLRPVDIDVVYSPYVQSVAAAKERIEAVLIPA